MFNSFEDNSDVPAREAFMEERFDVPEDDEPTVADYIRWEQQAMLDQMEADMGIEPAGWEDCY